MRTCLIPITTHHKLFLCAIKNSAEGTMHLHFG
jgi:hypothetical protein